MFGSTPKKPQNLAKGKYFKHASEENSPGFKTLSGHLEKGLSR